LEVVLPGEKVAVIEEFIGEDGIYLEKGILRALRIGELKKDFKSRELKVKSKISEKIPRLGDTIIGQVDIVQTYNIIVKIYYINGKFNYGRFEGILPNRSFESHDYNKKRTICKIGDLIRAQITSTKNSIAHLTLKDEEDGVLHSVCSICGGTFMKISHKIKCRECGNVEDRKLSINFY
jgi:exosome complex component CSL4